MNDDAQTVYRVWVIFCDGSSSKASFAYAKRERAERHRLFARRTGGIVKYEVRPELRNDEIKIIEGDEHPGLEEQNA